MRAITRRLGAALFADGWSFMVPYLVLYLAFQLPGPRHGLVASTRLLHVLLGLLFVAACSPG